MDLGSLFGFLATWALVFWALLSGGDLMIFYDFPSVILVLGGSITTLFACYPPRYLKSVFKVVMKGFLTKPQSIETLIAQIVSFAEAARKDGILSLENKTREIKDPFLVAGIQMAVDGTDPEMIEEILTNEVDNMTERHALGKAILDSYGKYGPAFGMIGTLVGLVIMLQNMDDPSKIGPGMAVAILTTLYGALIANVFAGPLGDRIARRSAEEAMYKTVVIKGVMAIQSGDNPRLVEQKLRTFLPPSLRKSAEQRDAA